MPLRVSAAVEKKMSCALTSDERFWRGSGWVMG
jgi:hypothetical protein